MFRKMEQKTVPVYMYSFGVFIMVLTGHMRLIQGQTNCRVPGSSISICSALDLQGSNIRLYGLQPAQQGTGCQCILMFNDSSHIGGLIAINVTANNPGGCQNELHFIHNSTTKIYNCRDHYPVYTFNVSVHDNLQITLVEYDRMPTGGFAFCFNVSTEPELNMHLVCNKPNISGMTPSTTTMEIMSDTTVLNTSTTTTEITQDIARSSINGMIPSVTTTEIMPDTVVPKSTQTITDERVTDQNTNLTSTDENGDIVQSKLGVIIGGSIGGLTVIIVIIIIIVCVIRKRRKDKTCESPEIAETGAHPYQNIPDNRSGEIIHQHKQNNELVHQENDPYTSIDNDIIKPSNGNQGMEYLENDRYVADDVGVNDDKLKAKLPVVAEYAQVNKSNANKTTNGKFKLGPKGDNYAVVNKGGKMINNDKRNEQFKIGPRGDKYAVVNKEGKKKNNEAGKQFKIGPSGDQYAVVNKEGRVTSNN